MMKCVVDPKATSAQEALVRFDTPQAATKYLHALPGTQTHEREVRCLVRALAPIPRGAKVLDLPCGAGRLLPMFLRLGYDVTAMDSSVNMVNMARQEVSDQGLVMPAEKFLVADVMNTGMPDNAFDAVICNRLFHHFYEVNTRRAALVELSRICSGRLIISFFNSHTFDGLNHRLHNALTRQPPTDRVAISPHRFLRDVKAVNLRMVEMIAARPWISRQYYAVLVRN